MMGGYFIIPPFHLHPNPPGKIISSSPMLHGTIPHRNWAQQWRCICKKYRSRGGPRSIMDRWMDISSSLLSPKSYHHHHHLVAPSVIEIDFDNIVTPMTFLSLQSNHHHHRHQPAIEIATKSSMFKRRHPQ